MLLPSSAIRLARLESILADAQAGKGTIGKLMTDESLYNSVNQTANNVATFSGEGTKLLYDFRQNPKKFLSDKALSLLDEQIRKDRPMSLSFYSMVLRAGLEPARIAPHAPQTCAATNYATSAGL